jgi:hypothetical protein
VLGEAERWGEQERTRMTEAASGGWAQAQTQTQTEAAPAGLAEAEGRQAERQGAEARGRGKGQRQEAGGEGQEGRDRSALLKLKVSRSGSHRHCSYPMKFTNTVHTPYPYSRSEHSFMQAMFATTTNRMCTRRRLVSVGSKPAQPRRVTTTDST